MAEIVLDALSYKGGGYGEELAQGGLTAFHVTAWPFQADFEEAMDHVGAWLGRIEADARLRLARTYDDLVAAAESGGRQVAVILGSQNARPLGSNLDRPRLFKAAGVNILQLTYMERNFYGDGCLEPDNGGLSRLGRLMIKAMHQAGITIDLSHVGIRSSLEALAMADKPMVYTHACCRALNDNPRNKTDEQIKAVAAVGGVMGISSYGRFIWRGSGHPRPNLGDVIAHIEHVVDLVGIDHVGLGLDSPIGLSRKEIDDFIVMMNTTYREFLEPYLTEVGATFEHRYAEGMVGVKDFPNLRRALLERGWKQADVAKLMGGNFARVFRQTWGS